MYSLDNHDCNDHGHDIMNGGGDDDDDDNDNGTYKEITIPSLNFIE